MGAGGGGLPKVGEVLNGKYELVRTLGEGGMAVVFEARHCGSGQRVAIKVLAPELVRDQEIVARFDREARAVGRLRTRHVAHVLEVDRIRGAAVGVPFIVMDFLDGRDLHAELETRKTLPVSEAVDYVLQACAAMDEAHRAGIIHRDLKPANLFLTTTDHQQPATNIAATRIVKVLDFGISKLAGETSKLTGAGAVMGTVIYMSPEQVKSSSDVDHRTDIWSLGVILFELLAGRAPFEGPGHKVALAIVTQDVPNLRNFAPDVPPPVAEAIAMMLQRDLHRRYSDMREVATALAPYAAPGSVGAAVVQNIGGGSFTPQNRSTAGKTMPLERASDLAAAVALHQQQQQQQQHVVQKKTLPLAMSAFVANAGNMSPPAASSSLAPLSASPPGSNPTPSSNRQPKPAAAAAADPSRQALTIRRSRRPRNRLPALIAGAVLGVLAAIGVVLIVLTLFSSRDGKATAKASSTHPSLPPSASMPPPIATTSEPPPPPTGVAESPSASASASASSITSATSATSAARPPVVPPSATHTTATTPTATTPPSATSNPALL